jgi:hypothetical protein
MVICGRPVLGQQPPGRLKVNMMDAVKLAGDCSFTNYGICAFGSEGNIIQSRLSLWQLCGFLLLATQQALGFKNRNENPIGERY